ncbi:hypothetical protein LY28_03504 [Ruminiclostridium sufflavum DSM 19573]|uniref:Uncharacterized protein n=1 Tax=Ruminiclostridium sufflavum DSM 19573 TaxID=1121337 RepID=A0A318XHP4_9FIRM|nr:hypothetical protein [Ruminiclostridium sufflavum]PYG84883.1 hypothetical protein LY28_03504 [Ruminiclostridium sufflavum DSM 19573]
MHKNRKLLYLLVISAVVAAVLFCIAYINNKANTEKSLEVAFNESKASQAELIEDSDIIVRCVFEGEPKTENKTAMTTGADGKEFTITSPVTAYKMKLVENLKGVVNNEFEIGLIGSKDNKIENGAEYVLFLDKSNENGSYRLVSYNQGFNKVKQKSSDLKNSTEKFTSVLTSDSTDESIEIESVATKEIINYKALKDKIKELDK